MAGRSRITSRPPFSCFKRSTKLRLRARSQVISTAEAVGLLSGMHGLLVLHGAGRNLERPRLKRGVSVSSDCQVQERRMRTAGASRSHPPATGTKHLGGRSEGRDG